MTISPSDMSSVTTTKSALAGTKRKLNSVQVDKSKKPKLGLQSTSKSKTSKESQPKASASISESSSTSDADSDGGVVLEGFSEVSSKGERGLHPERAKVVAANSMLRYYA